MAKVTIIGSGNVGANTAFFLAEQSVADVFLYDIQEGMPEGKALDMMEAAPVRGYQRLIRGTSSLDVALDSDVVVVCAGAVRKPGMSREDLLEENRATISELARDLRETRAVVVMVTEPVDFLTKVFLDESGLPWQRVLGLGGVLDANRLRYLVSNHLGVSSENVTATVIGRHGKQMIPLKHYTRVSGIPVDTMINNEDMAGLFHETRDAGDLIVDLAQRSSAFYGPSSAAAEVVRAIVWDTGHIAPVSVLFSGQYGIEGVCMSLPCVLGVEGIRKVLEPKLTDSQATQLENSAKAEAAVLAGGKA